MSLNIKGGIVNIGTYHDNSKEYHINAKDSNISDILQQIEPDNEPKQPIQVEEILPIPPKGKYTKVREYIKERSRFDEEFKHYVDTHTRVDLCKRLTNEFGWDVDEHHLGVNMNRNR